MIAVIFEGIPNEGQKEEYFEMAAALKSSLKKIEGFISNERFQSCSNPEKVLSLSFWENEDGIKQLRNLELHRLAEEKGRDSLFKDYRIRIANVARDYGMFDRKDAPAI
jgi:heme-degrading monooxygenase HmoA